jgi:succinylglutamate desuccinylase
MNKINRVLIVGGIYGNELSGAYLIKKFERVASQMPQGLPHLLKDRSFQTQTLLSNPINSIYKESTREFCTAFRKLRNTIEESFCRQTTATCRVSFAS